MTASRSKTYLVVLALIALVVGLSGYTWWQKTAASLPLGLASGNGRLEATEIDVATRNPGRLADVLIGEGDWVETDAVLARMDTSELEALQREARADLRRLVESRKYAIAIVEQRKSELGYADRELGRSQQLVAEGHVSRERLDQVRTRLRIAQTALQAANIKVVESEAAIEAARARIERLQAQQDDSVLVAPRDGRVLYRLAEAGEVLGAGGKVVTLLDLTDVYMTIFLPTADASLVDVGAEARILLDALPDVAIPARVSFVAARSQFTPREVETRSEREKLMFRVKVKIDPRLLKKYAERVKTGVPGAAYVRLDPEVSWPEYLQVPERLRVD